MKWKATQDEASKETGEEEPISTTQTDFLAFSSLLLWDTLRHIHQNTAVFIHISYLLLLPVL